MYYVHVKVSRHSPSPLIPPSFFIPSEAFFETRKPALIARNIAYGAAAHRKFLKLSVGGILCMSLFSILKSALTSDFRHIASKSMDSIRSGTITKLYLYFVSPFRLSLLIYQPDTADLPPLRELTLEKASEGLRLESFISADLVKAYIARIDEVSEFNAVLQINPDALEVARRLDEERTRTGSRGYVSSSPDVS